MAAEATGLSPFETEFARAWDTPGHTRYRLPDTDVNLMLAARYATSKPLALTRGMLWDMEVRKAAHPGTYIPLVVRAGSDRSWNRRGGDGGEYLDRCSMQRLWLHPQQYELILERAFISHHEQKVTLPRRARAHRRRRRAAARWHRPAAVPCRALGRRHRIATAEPLAHRPPHRRPR